MARFLITPFGSGGDVNPHLWLGRLLRARGHEACIITLPMFREMAERSGLEFIPVGSEEEFMTLLHHRDLWRPVAGTKLVFREALRATPLFFEAIARELSRGPAVLVSPFHQFGARMAREKFGVPLVTVHLQPSCFLSAWDMPVFLTWFGWMRRLPRWMRSLLLSGGATYTGFLRPELKRLCLGSGVVPPSRPIPDWMYSPDANLVLFPEWFAAPQPDWPPHTRSAGFPQEDLRAQFEMPGDIEEFLARGEKPVLFSPGTGNAQSRDFFATAVEACSINGSRALLGTRFSEALPQPLPSWARSFDYIPFSELLPRVAALVHHGGIGTTSQALAAGVPQLVMPMAHDQPDNASRLKRLGAGDWIAPRKFTAANVARALRHLTTDSGVAQACDRAAKLCREDRAADIAVETLEQAAEQGVNRVG